MQTRIPLSLCCAWLLAVVSPLAGQPQGDDPIGEVAAKMNVVVGHLTRRDTGKATQAAQQEVINQLDAMIVLLEQQQQQLRNAGRVTPLPSQPAADSTVRSGPGGSGDLRAARREGDRWGKLPPHQRDRITQSLNDGFPAHYRQVLERYYRWLASEQPVPAAARPAGAPASQPGP